MPIRWSLLGVAAVALAVQAQPAPEGAAERIDGAAERASVPSRPSVPSTPMAAGAPLPEAAAPVAGVDRPRTSLLGGGSFGTNPAGPGLENVLNSGTPPAWDRRSGSHKVCPPGLENRHNVCAAPLGSILSP
ncbi:hypothetical protein PE066_13375 [Ramlibacter tataouinensis]|uniref:hypothetical protein n=1 Tax=Ramlibacter tataouinensis TaxID=94132 RepID=UPI0022F4030C|nr:hypothetical protein [Ramlibacter tataouinensis]WBY00458.1 hypothetical protein PE066_13375 [Ramlibacter tataouinensis]